MLKYTLCFIKKGSQILMLNRCHAPVMGKWNGIGGKLEAGETAEQCVVREALEETGIHIDHPEFVGTVTWITEKGSSGMYVFTADVSSDFVYAAPVKVEEGILDWKELEWILSPDNIGIANHIQQFLPIMLSGESWEHRYTYHSNGELIGYDRQPLTAAEQVEVLS